MASELLVATKSRHADAKATVSGLSNWFSSLPVPDSIQCDNGSHFTSVMVQDWAKKGRHQMGFSYTLLSPSKRDCGACQWFVEMLPYAK